MEESGTTLDRSPFLFPPNWSVRACTTLDIVRSFSCITDSCDSSRSVYDVLKILHDTSHRPSESSLRTRMYPVLRACCTVCKICKSVRETFSISVHTVLVYSHTEHTYIYTHTRMYTYICGRFCKFLCAIVRFVGEQAERKDSFVK